MFLSQLHMKTIALYSITICTITITFLTLYSLCLYQSMNVCVNFLHIFIMFNFYVFIMCTLIHPLATLLHTPHTNTAPY